MSDISGLTSLDPAIAMKARSIQNMPPDKAIQVLLSSGVDSRTAAMVMKNMMLKKAAAQGKAPPPTKTVSQELDDRVNNLATQHAPTAGVAGLSVPETMFGGSSGPAGMAGGGIVAFDDGGPTSQSPSGTDYGTEAYSLQQAMANQQMQQQAQQVAQSAGLMGLAGGGQIKHYATGGVYSEDQVDTPQHQSNLSAIDRWMQETGGITPPRSYADEPDAAPTPAPTPAAAAQPPGAGPSPFQQQAPQASQGPPGTDFMAGQKPPGLEAQGSHPPAIPPSAPPGPNGGQGFGISMKVGPNGMPVEMQQMMDRQQSQLDAAKPQSYDSHLNELQDRAQKMGIGQAAETHLQELDQQKQQVGQMAQQGKWLALAQAGFAMASAATNNPHGGFLGALAVGGQKGAEDYGKTIAQYHNQLMQVQDASYRVRETQEAVALDQSKQALAAHENEVNRFDRLMGQMDASQIKATELVFGKEATLATLRMNKYMSDNAFKGSAQDVAYKKWYENFSKQYGRDPGLYESSEALRTITQSGNQYQTAELKGQDAAQREAASLAQKNYAAQLRASISPQNLQLLQMQAAKGDPHAQQTLALLNGESAGVPSAAASPQGGIDMSRWNVRQK